MNGKKYTITEAAEKAFEEVSETLSLEEIHSFIIDNNLFTFKEGANSLHILKTQLNRRTINSNLSYKNQDLLFYIDAQKKYGLLEFLPEGELAEYLSDNEINKLEKQKYKNVQNEILELTQRLDGFDKLFQNFHEVVDGAEEARGVFENVKKSFEEETKLHASRQYWNEKKQLHLDKVKLFIRVFLGTILFIPILSMVCLIWVLPHIEDSFIYLGMGILLLITSILIWASRIVLKIMLSNLHLQEEAREKETMILTYLALIKEGAGLDNDNRKLILEAIFRPSSNGIIKDDR